MINQRDGLWLQLQQDFGIPASILNKSLGFTAVFWSIFSRLQAELHTFCTSDTPDSSALQACRDADVLVEVVSRDNHLRPSEPKVAACFEKGFITSNPQVYSTQDSSSKIRTSRRIQITSTGFITSLKRKVWTSATMPSVMKTIHFLTSTVVNCIAVGVLGYGLSTDWAKTTMDCANGTALVIYKFFNGNITRTFCPAFGGQDTFEGNVLKLLSILL